jgi:hypothetical protein
VLERLEATRGLLYDMHGNAEGGLRELMVMRFDATASVEARIESLESRGRNPDLASALYDVLAFVKDPASIPWLERRLRSKVIADRYLPAWHGGGQWEWLTGRDRWIAFFQRAIENETRPERRVEYVWILSSFDDPEVRSFFIAREKSAADPREVLLVEAYLRQHGLPIDDSRITAAVARLKSGTANRDLLLSTASELRHEAFVPYLIDTLDVADQYVYPANYQSQDLLEAITFQRGIAGKRAWKAWYAMHLGEGHSRWVEAAIASFRQGLERDPAGALASFDKAIYRWNDIDALPLVRDDLLPRAAFHDDIAGWINLTYTGANRERLAPIAKVLAEHPERLQDWARQLLIERKFLPDPAPPLTWRQYVQQSNSHV